MIHRHGSPRFRTGDAVSVPLPADRTGRLLLLAVALGLVLMHHVVGAHQHTAAEVAVTAAPSAHPGGEHPAAHEAQPGMTVASSAALLHHHPDGGGHDHADSLLHLCLVALVGAAVVLLTLVLAAAWWRSPARPSAQGARWAAAPRAPPTSSRLAELQVLRL
ncbi:DUF6153 family protein [Actinomycetospora cinnamomea]|uniref:DUF6153 family protein n=1 Tax=Actinomycetospora cinnamomea TaxID=663609 RepID=UPI0010580254|nr:DUF6153 family protein [Actinomycetospora cinnamomea]